VKLKTFNTGLAALSLMVAPAMASAAKPVVTPLTQPASETVGGDSELRGGGSGVIVAVLAVVLIGLAIYIAQRGGDRPNSP
jgi:hypothetical protein